MRFGHDDDLWRAAKEEAKQILSERAAEPVNFTICYSDLCNLIQTIGFDYHSKEFSEFLGEISAEEHSEGRGMLSAIVIHKHGDLKPGTGFRNCAAGLGLDVSDIDRVWSQQLNFVHDHWMRAARV
jgi:hypothetical protein